MTDNFVWSEIYSVGEPVIDQQHRKLFDIGNDILNSSVDTCDTVIFELYKYIRYHFNDEEKMFKNLGYDNLQYHKSLHDKIIDTLFDITENGINSEAELKELWEFLYEWLVAHVMNEDKKAFSTLT